MSLGGKNVPKMGLKYNFFYRSFFQVIENISKFQCQGRWRKPNIKSLNIWIQTWKQLFSIKTEVQSLWRSEDFMACLYCLNNVISFRCKECLKFSFDDFPSCTSFWPHMVRSTVEKTFSMVNVPPSKHKWLVWWTWTTLNFLG